jgi:hypothetical protein
VGLLGGVGFSHTPEGQGCFATGTQGIKGAQLYLLLHLQASFHFTPCFHFSAWVVLWPSGAWAVSAHMCQARACAGRHKLSRASQVVLLVMWGNPPTWRRCCARQDSFCAPAGGRLGVPECWFAGRLPDPDRGVSVPLCGVYDAQCGLLLLHCTP